MSIFRDVTLIWRLVANYRAVEVLIPEIMLEDCLPQLLKGRTLFFSGHL
jgi:hypothetical protein